MTLPEKARAELHKLDQKIIADEAAIARLPQGILVCRRNGSYTKWFHKLPLKRGEGEMRYLKKSQRHLAELLARKTYLKKRLELMKHERAAIEAYLKKHDTAKEGLSALSLISLGVRDLLASSGRSLTDERTMADELNNWRHTDYQKCPYHPEALTVPVSETLYVRSKSEAFIAAALQENGIPFRYECELILGSTPYYPDFTIRHPTNGRFIYWEHFGLMDKPDYASRAYSKLRVYNENGIIPTINLITTFETSSSPLNLQLVKSLIEFYLI